MDAMHARQHDAAGDAGPKRGGYRDLSGWAKEVVDGYAAFKGSVYSRRASEEAKRYAPGFFVFAGLADSRGPQDVTADAIVEYVAHCGRKPKAKGPRLIHLRGILSFMADSGIVPEWAALLAHERFACYSCCYGRADGWEGEPGLPAEELLQAARQMVEEMRAMGYRTRFSIDLMVVVLPAPLRPMNPAIFPAASENDTASSVKSGYAFVRFRPVTTSIASPRKNLICMNIVAFGCVWFHQPNLADSGDFRYLWLPSMLFPLVLITSREKG